MTLALMAAPLAETAHAYSATWGTLSFNGEPGEPISGGRSYEYTSGAVQMFDVQGSTDENSLTVAMDAGQRTLWRLNIAAPDGEQLTEGTTYTGTRQWPDAQPADPELTFSGTDGGTEKWCNTSSGSFTIEHIAFGPYGYVHELDATFEQYCNGSTVPLRGAVHAVMPEPPVVLAMGMNVGTEGPVAVPEGRITVGGTVNCNKPASVSVVGQVFQIQKKGTPSATYETTVACTPGSPIPWSVSLTGQEPGISFQPGPATVRSRARANDGDCPVSADTGQQDSAVRLSKS
ncbi:hypothetical protein SAMN05428944_7813 [Streptomyces sp. 1222.5]|uniref:hypothetical protein n=1 Tax=unclassified Streptomyces TaxID=2593676 RepID=UPI00089BC7EF|nr:MULTISPECIES: hypothetical protein [unclassified Streptomyces]PKW05186.1 hypothetical protein BX260_0270 [Streptomyces sp. 5112.2]SED47878.1 hypothetical protein SAMN05428944_7813 [Streptomyces sp. 1222.5]